MPPKNSVQTFLLRAVLSNLALDIDGQTRSNPPDVGADEY